MMQGIYNSLLNKTCFFWFVFCFVDNSYDEKLTEYLSNMLIKMKNTLLTLIGASLVALGLLFILLPGPAVIFLPLGLAILSLQYSWARVWLKRCQRMMRQSAEQLDRWLLKIKHRRR